jgi:molybdenum cofactor synthesis domain-containing protein
MTERDGSKARASAICIRWNHLPGDDGDVARKNGWAVLISAAKPRDFNMLPGQGFGGRAQSGWPPGNAAILRGEVMSEIVTAGILVIGDEILSGRTKDKNIGFIAEYLTNIGIDLKEVRVVADEEAEIIAALDALRHRYSYVFTTGGIGPTHDDITADSIARAFGVGIDHHPDVVARFRERFQGAGELNEARLRMARIPDGAELIQSATILAPGFKIGNVIVMAGVPSIMQAMMDIVAPKLKSGVRMLSETVRANAREGDIGGPLRDIANAHPDTVIGSYPFQDEDKKPNTNLVVRSRDPDKLNAAMAAVKEMLAGLNVVR